MLPPEFVERVPGVSGVESGSSSPGGMIPTGASEVSVSIKAMGEELGASVGDTATDGVRVGSAVGLMGDDVGIPVGKTSE